jgi:hypothetical protein
VTAEPTSVWIVSAPDDAGVYHLALEVGDDRSVPLKPDEAVAWGRNVLWALNAAEYDAAVLKQMTETTGDQSAAAHLVKAVREDRASSVRVGGHLGIDLVPGVSAFTGKPFLHLMQDGKLIGQWTPDDARQHALAVLQAVENLGADTAYLRALEQHVSLDRPTALAVISGLAEYRTPGEVQG